MKKISLILAFALFLNTLTFADELQSENSPIEIYTFKLSKLINSSTIDLKVKKTNNQIYIIPPKETIEFENAIIIFNHQHVMRAMSKNKKFVVIYDERKLQFDSKTKSKNSTRMTDWCYEYCSDIALPTSDGSGFDFWNCLTDCLGVAGGEYSVCANDNYIGWLDGLDFGGCLINIGSDAAFEYIDADPTDGINLIIDGTIVYP
ncbi:motile sperm domain-containing protein [Desulfoluna spongiiphila]|uniref:hypothetical protein n=1 Tax=Desulfoluna spongiiphila TaxID=419481 RepID=UPI001251240C|nr:hypothetical protein [Desulfoluna spongiiphila]VVS92619.1 hypothetical protein DBB_21870 [Desulfoluna spongiiphila]